MNECVDCEYPPLGAPPLDAYRGAAREYTRAGENGSLYRIANDAPVERGYHGAWVTLKVWMNDADADRYVDDLVAQQANHQRKRARLNHG